MRTILHILATAQLEAAGIARIVIAAARAATPRGYRTRAVFMDGDGPLVARLCDAGVPADVVYWGGARNLAGDLRAWRYVRRLAPDIVHQHFGSEYLRGLMRLAGVRRIVAHFHDHGCEIEQGATVPHSALFADAAVATSQSVRALIRGRIEPIVVYPGVVAIDEEPPPALETRPPVIGTLSRLAPVKGHIHLVRAMPAILARVPQARLEIVGDGPERPALAAEVRRLGVSHAVEFLGWQDDPGPLLDRWRVLAAPSVMEGFGLSILEAAMRGLPIVATRVGGVPELLEDAVSGMLVPPADPGALACALVACLVDTPRARSLGRHAAERARRLFAPEKFDAAVVAVYDRL